MLTHLAHPFPVASYLQIFPHMLHFIFCRAQRIAFGDHAAGANAPLLRQHDVHTVINLSLEAHTPGVHASFAAAGVHYQHLPVRDCSATRF